MSHKANTVHKFVDLGIHKSVNQLINLKTFEKLLKIVQFLKSKLNCQYAVAVVNHQSAMIHEYLNLDEILFTKNIMYFRLKVNLKSLTLTLSYPLVSKNR